MEQRSSCWGTQDGRPSASRSSDQSMWKLLLQLEISIRNEYTAQFRRTALFHTVGWLVVATGWLCLVRTRKCEFNFNIALFNTRERNEIWQLTLCESRSLLSHPIRSVKLYPFSVRCFGEGLQWRFRRGNYYRRCITLRVLCIPTHHYFYV